MLEDSDIAGFDISAYVLPILQREFKRAGIEFSLEHRAVVDAMQIFHLKEPRDLATACRFYLSVKHQHSHSALEDARITLRVLESQLHRYRDLPCDPLSLCDVCAPGNDRYVDSGKKFEWRRRQAALAFGAHYGRFLRDIAREDPDYLGWMAETDLPTDTKEIAREALKGKFPKRTMTEKDD
jgi:DNA polymerase-3 subunit epsilon